jgi:hypothetical protein
MEGSGGITVYLFKLVIISAEKMVETYIESDNVDIEEQMLTSNQC